MFGEGEKRDGCAVHAREWVWLVSTGKKKLGDIPGNTGGIVKDVYPLEQRVMRAPTRRLTPSRQVFHDDVALLGVSCRCKWLAPGTVSYPRFQKPQLRVGGSTRAVWKGLQRFSISVLMTIVTEYDF